MLKVCWADVTLRRLDLRQCRLRKHHAVCNTGVLEHLTTQGTQRTRGAMLRISWQSQKVVIKYDTKKATITWLNQWYIAYTLKIYNWLSQTG